MIFRNRRVWPPTDLTAIAVIQDTVEWTWHDVFARADGIARDLPRDKRIGLHLSNHPDLVPLIVALWANGSTPVFLHPKFPDTWVEQLRQDVGWRVTLTDKELGELSTVGAPSSFEIDPSTFASVVFTSGSKGTPKGIAHTFDAHFASALGANQRMPFLPGDRWLVSLPMCHVGGLAILFRAIVGGGALHFPRAGTSVADALTEIRPTHISFVPTQLRRVLAQPRAVDVLQEAKTLLIGGAPLSPSVREECRQKRIPIRETYGMSETASQVATGEVLSADCGPPLDGREVRIRDGEIEVRGRVLGEGYFVSGDVAPFVDREGWFRTGDTGHLDHNGNLQVRGRVDNMFISGGENIQPEMIEAVLAPFFRTPIVVPVGDETFGQRPFLFVDEEVGMDDLLSVCDGRLPRFMWPIGVAAIGTFETLKISRAVLERRANAIVAETD